LQKIELFPNLDHCIETVAKRKHAELLQQLLEGEADNIQTAEQVEILRLFLETENFRKLRSESEKQLIEGKSVRFTVYLEGSIPKYKMKVGNIEK
jgi:hypothetical protein